MHNPTVLTVVLWPFMAYAVIVILLVSIILLLSYLLGQHHKEHATAEPYESGIKQTGPARLRFSVQFYLVAMLFVIFDVETIFIVLWALVFKELGWIGYLSICAFIGILIAVLIYEWSIGALDFGPNGKKILKAYRKRKE
ncbi:NADH-quinone oxidoreductase subunit A [Solitalea lacus]|uniref:NADH-quinone oxidoreductase subunit A n=1 Tax=Solitalea lacus TaxID=2911172 RepID=UPI001EDA9B92|nr:NADH-quinone oxidoreductase subunit A [Solitalea lacus]UKJ07157.1 NADH-quinone oxidoreductase subunit A [Solitalea lacus]